MGLQLEVLHKTRGLTAKLSLPETRIAHLFIPAAIVPFRLESIHMQRNQGNDQRAGAKGGILLPRRNQLVLGVPDVKLTQHPVNKPEHGTSKILKKARIVESAQLNFVIYPRV